uniref:Pentacotripeptide-repeat region of PRORP domain-containing protein n=1 Tax=Fagus sylvatica TaxID=28930 RepID=A0A2N9GMA1_FAGSY
MEKSWLFFNWASRLKGFKHDQFTYTTMLDIFGEAGRIASMKHVFEQMQEKGLKIDAVTYTSLMHWLSSSGDVDGAMKVWEEMKGNGCFLTVVSYTAYMKLLFDNGRASEATDAYKEMLRSGCAPTCHTYTILMEYLVGSGECNTVFLVEGVMIAACGKVSVWAGTVTCSMWPLRWGMDALVSSILVSHLGGDGRSWNVKFLRDFHDWELESATSFLELIYSHLPRGNGCDKPNWQLNGSGVFDV